MSYQPTTNPLPTKYGDGTGRNSYVVCTFGGSNLSPTDRQKPPVHHTPLIGGNPTPRSYTRFTHYVNDGSGRDGYVTHSMEGGASNKAFDFQGSLRQPIERNPRANLRPLSAASLLEKKRATEQLATSKRLSTPKTQMHPCSCTEPCGHTRRSAGADRTMTMYAVRQPDKDVYGVPIRIKAYNPRVSCVANQRSTKGGFQAPTYSRSGNWLSQ